MIQSSKQFTEVLEAVRKESSFLRRIRFLAAGQQERGLPARALTVREIEILEKQGNRAEDWDLLSVSPEFLPERVLNSYFAGPCYLGRFEGGSMQSSTQKRGSEELPPSSCTLSPGIYGSILCHSTVFDNALVCGNTRLEYAIVCGNAEVYRSTVLGRGGAAEKQENPFGIGSPCRPGLETGGRNVRLYPGLDRETAMFLCEHPADAEIRKSYNGHVEMYRQEAMKLPYSVIDEGASVESCTSIRDAYIGPYAKLTGTLEVRASVVVSEQERQVLLGPGIICRHSVIGPGAVIDSGAVVETCGVFASSRIDRHAKAAGSLLGPQIEFSEGEITASFAGPFIGFHHQALLISAYWPEGKGNIGYGANVGSNHTSRLPDQEIQPGEGMFFGLGCSVKFPAHFRNAPYTVIATGTVTMPQKMEFPFSCIVPRDAGTADAPPGYNRLLPGWCIYRNMYMCVRGAYKYAKRGIGTWEAGFLEVFRKPVMEQVLRSFQVLQGSLGGRDKPDKEIYTDLEIPELGKNTVSSGDLVLALEWYTFILKYYACKQLFASDFRPVDKHTPAVQLFGNSTVTPTLFTAVYKDDTSLGRLAEDYTALLETFESLTVSSKEKDSTRGEYIIEDYKLTHPSIAEDPVIIEMRAETAKEREKITPLLS
jgi:hypothetical protein